MTSRSYITLMIFGAIIVSVVVFFAGERINADQAATAETPVAADLDLIAKNIQSNLAGAVTVEDQLSRIRDQLPSVEEFTGGGEGMPPTPPPAPTEIAALIEAAPTVAAPAALPTQDPALIQLPSQPVVVAQPEVYALPTQPPPIVVAQPVYGRAYNTTDGQRYISTPVGEMPCNEIFLEWGGKDAQAQMKDYAPWYSWFESIPQGDRVNHFYTCNG